MTSIYLRDPDGNSIEVRCKGAFIYVSVLYLCAVEESVASSVCAPAAIEISGFADWRLTDSIHGNWGPRAFGILGILAIFSPRA